MSECAYCDFYSRKTTDLEQKLADSEADWIKMRDIAEETQRKLEEATKIIRCLAGADANSIGATQVYINIAKDFLAKIEGDTNNQLNDTK